MILQSLQEYYDRKAADPESDIAPEGFEKRKLPFLIVVDEEGEFIGIEDTRKKIGNRLVAETFLLPRSKIRTGKNSYKTAFLLWDHIGYLLGLPTSDEKSAKQHQTWLNKIESLPAELLSDAGVNAVIQFYRKGGVAKAITSPNIRDCLELPRQNMSFRLSSDVPVPCRKAVQDYVSNNLDLLNKDKKGDKNGICLVTGKSGVIARIHGAVLLSKDTKSLVSVQSGCGYDSYKKRQGYNAPIVRSTEFAYVTALNTLLKSESQRLVIGDTTTVFWSAKKSSFESDFLLLFEEPKKDNPDDVEKIRALFDSIKTGNYHEDNSTEFYILGLAPNRARIFVRFWQTGTIPEFAARIKQYFDEFTIVKHPDEPEHYSIWRILLNIAPQNKIENIPPHMASDFMKSILNGTLYPATLFQAALRRIRSDPEKRVNSVRAALIKAYLNRHFNQTNQKEVNVELDASQPSVGYQIGRLFAALERIQKEAGLGDGANIRRRFYGAACSSPSTVFANLLRLKNHHLTKFKNKGRTVYFEKLLGEIMNKLNGFPAHLGLHEQGMFAVGYYHQRQAFYTKNNLKQERK